MKKLTKFFSKIYSYIMRAKNPLIGIYLILFTINLFSKKIDGLVEPVLFLSLVSVITVLEWDAEETARFSVYPFLLMIIFSFFDVEFVPDRFAVLGISLLAISAFQKIKRYLDESKVTEQQV